MRTVLKVVLVAVALALTAAYVYLNPPARLNLVEDTLTRFPLVLEGWTGHDRRFKEVVYEDLSADATLARRYDRGDETVWFVIIFHQNVRYGAHEPVLCYTSHGWEVIDRGLTRVRRQGGQFDASWLLVRSDRETRLAVYWWFTSGELATHDRDEFMARMAKSGILSNVSFGAYVRVSTVVEGGDVETAMRRIVGFASAASEHVPGLFDERSEGE